MSDTDAETSPDTDEVGISELLERILARLSGLTASVDGFAVRQQELLGRDYSEDLGKIDARWGQVCEAFAKLKERPGFALTPQMIAEQIEAAGRQVRTVDHEEWRKSHHRLEETNRAVALWLGSARAAKRQNKWLGTAAGAAAFLGFIGGCTVPPLIDQAVPDGWYWPEKRAAASLRRDGWEAGRRLLQVSDPTRWQETADAENLLRANREALQACRKKAAGKAPGVSCNIRVHGAGASR
ncbi:MAG: hypothetical protein JNN10_00760 [Sphingopyxis sp.]|uniref:DUF6118 family protein n=1 Tax=Sphingopyxis sp. TaxID=1908224 RepID=UPI001A5C61EF|nr:DUF6118 family protein [Sphingopyxis sp.]MBL9064804.1 hypothetical protein [Sphingopyxis sp.]